MKRYSEADILEAAKRGEVSMIDAKHIVSILKEMHEEKKYKLKKQ